jgi:uncharacterized phage protein (TIGR02220 family)
MKLIPKNWNEFQQYKDRKPQWIKFHRDLLNDFAYSNVHINTKATLPLLWLLACEYENGIINATVEEIAFRIHIDKSIVLSAIEELIDKKFFTLVQECTEEYKSVPREEKRRDKEEIEKEDIYIPFVEIINHLNLKANTKYKATGTKTKELIKARFNDGFTLEDFIVVIDKKTNEWISDKKMSVYLRPETLFSNKFEGYLNQVVAKSKLDLSGKAYDTSRDEEEF